MICKNVIKILWRLSCVCVLAICSCKQDIRYACGDKTSNDRLLGVLTNSSTARAMAAWNAARRQIVDSRECRSMWLSCQIEYISSSNRDENSVTLKRMAIEQFRYYSEPGTAYRAWLQTNLANGYFEKIGVSEMASNVVQSFGH